MLEAEVHTVPMAGPADVSQIATLFDAGTVDPAHVVGVIAQTEGDGYARGYATQSLQLLLSERLSITTDEIFETIPMLMIGGTAGIMCPHWTLFVNKPASGSGDPDGPRLVLGVASSRRLLPEELGGMAQVEQTVATVRTAMAHAGISDPDDVACVELKVPHVTPARVADAARRGHTMCDPNLLTASGKSRGAAALGTAVALGEIDQSALSDAAIGNDTTLYCERASASSGGEQVSCRAVVIGNVAGAPSRLVAGNGVMADQLDLAGARAAFTAAGLELVDGMLSPAERERVAAVFVNAGANYAPDVLGNRHTMNSDFLASFAGHQAKAVAHVIVSSIKGDTLVLGNAGAEHQGKPGSNLVCVIARASNT